MKKTMHERYALGLVVGCTLACGVMAIVVTPTKAGSGSTAEKPPYDAAVKPGGSTTIVIRAVASANGRAYCEIDQPYSPPPLQSAAWNTNTPYTITQHGFSMTVNRMYLAWATCRVAVPKNAPTGDYDVSIADGNTVYDGTLRVQ